MISTHPWRVQARGTHRTFRQPFPRYPACRYIAVVPTLTEPAFFVLTSLVDQPRHGYGIVGTVEELSGDRVHLKVGTLYGVLDRLAAEGLVAPDRDEVIAGRLRRYYRLTEAGRGALDAEAGRQAANAQVAAERLRAHPAPTPSPSPRPRPSPRPAAGFGAARARSLAVAG
jgi:PadR family transcriptional regulator